MEVFLEDVEQLLRLPEPVRARLFPDVRGFSENSHRKLLHFFPMARNKALSEAIDSAALQLEDWLGRHQRGTGAPASRISNLTRIFEDLHSSHLLRLAKGDKGEDRKVYCTVCAGRSISSVGWHYLGMWRPMREKNAS